METPERSKTLERTYIYRNKYWFGFPHTSVFLYTCQVQLYHPVIVGHKPPRTFATPTPPLKFACEDICPPIIL